MKSLTLLATILLFCLMPLSYAGADCTLSVEVRDAIGPASLDYLERAEAKALRENCQSILVRINTPGGSLQTTRKIVEQIMASPIPYLCLVHPTGGHAGSAGAIIMQACHINGAMEATNIGAASPISSTGENMPEDLRKKVFEDTRSWVEGLVKYRGRNLEFARAIIEEAKALDAEEALEQGAIDMVAPDIGSFLEFAKDKPVRLDSEETAPVAVGPLKVFEPDLRHEVLQILSNPQWAYLIFMGSIGLLYFEMTHPGVIAPGVVGALGLVISLVNFHMLDVSWGGVILILLGMAFMFAELFVPSFGALGLGGLAAFITGSLFLFDEKSGYQIPLSLLISTSLALFMMMGVITWVALKSTQYARMRREKERLEGQTLVIKSFDQNNRRGMGFFQGELWKVQSTDLLVEEDRAVIKKVKGLTLVVQKESRGEV